MPDYKTLYEQLFDAMTNAIESLRKAQIETVDTRIEEEHKERNRKINANWDNKAKED
jgi:hypothetical protein